ncbi:hypothetical protein H4582DRAFT_2007663 [Lactarius indigo]|nr:hypothetical protein H4582DRAFT_2007663 [Lactarius indigo]
MTFICSPDAVTIQHIVDHRTSSGALEVPLLLFPIQVLDDLPHSLPRASLNSSVTGCNYAYFPPEYHSSPLAPASPGPSRAWSSSVPDLGSAAEGEGGATAALHKERDALDPSSVVLETVMTAPDLPPQFPPASSVTHTAVANPSQCPLVVEHTEPHPPHASFDQYDIA